MTRLVLFSFGYVATEFCSVADLEGFQGSHTEPLYHIARLIFRGANISRLSNVAKNSWFCKHSQNVLDYMEV